MFAAPAEGTLKDFMEFAETGFADHEQSPPNQRTHATEHYAELINRNRRYGRFRHASSLPKPTRTPSNLTPRNLPLSVITERYFVPQSQSRALLRDGVARLWWTAHVSFDPERANNYELTGTLLARLDITQQILERNMGRAPSVLKGFLLFLARHKNPLLEGGDINRARIRQLAIFLNLQGGVSILDCLEPEDIIKHLESEFVRILGREKPAQAQSAATEQ